MQVFCPQCGKGVPDDASFCGVCGTPLGGVPETLNGVEAAAAGEPPGTPPSAPASGGPSGPRRDRAWLVPAIIATCIVAAAGIGISVWRLAFADSGGDPTPIATLTPTPIASATPDEVASPSPAPTAASRLYPVIVDGKTGYIDRSGTLLISPDFVV